MYELGTYLKKITDGYNYKTRAAVYKYLHRQLE